MNLNSTAIEWTDRIISHVVGCLHGCIYCYAEKQSKRQKHRCDLFHKFIHNPHLERLNALKPTQEPMKIFIDSMWDWNSNGVKKEWLLKIVEKMKICSQYTFQILPKKPARYTRFSFLDNVWLGTLIPTNADAHRIDDLVKANSNNLKFVSVEPIHEKTNYWFSRSIDWIIVGAETGNRKGKVIPKKDWIINLIENARSANIPIFLKDNLNWPEKIQEFPRI